MTVLRECLPGPACPGGAAIAVALDADWLSLVPNVADERDWGLDAGETTTIQLALDRRAGLLMDDRAGRRIAGRLGLPVIGVLGVLVLAKRGGHLTRIRPSIEALIRFGYYLAGPVVDDALRLAGE